MSQPAIPICQGTTRNGTPCGSPALRGKPYCYFHAPGRPALHRARSTRTPLPLPPLDNHDAIQTALGHIITGLAADRMDPKSATAALYAIQCALQSLKLHRP